MLDSPLDAIDIASGMLAGIDGRVAPPEAPPGISVRQAVERCVLRALQRPPCLVSFSGGKDSSALLAVACDLAARHGLPAPVPATTLGTSEDMRESDWQGRVLDHLGVEERWTHQVTDQMEALGSIATEFLARHGVRYPWNVHFHHAIMVQATGGSVITGAGGDELFSPWQWARAAQLRLDPRRVRRSDALHLAGAVLPGPVQGRLLVRRNGISVPWLTRAGRRVVQNRMARWLGADRVSPSAHLVEWFWPSRYIQHGMRSLELLGEDHDVALVSPFTDGEVIASFARDRSRYSMQDRGEVMVQVFSDLLPEEVLRRRSKAIFGSLLFGPRTEQFVREWQPRSIDPGLVDVAALRQVWSEGLTDQRSIGLLRQEWLADHGSPVGMHG